MQADLKEYFHPVKVRPWKLLQEKDTVSASVVKLHDLDKVDLSEFHVALLGIDESVNASGNYGCRLSPQLIRPYLYGMRKNSRSLKILDLGNLLGNTIKDKYVALQDISRFFYSSKTPFIILGGSQDFTTPVYDGISQIQQQPKLCVVDSLFDFSDDDDYTSRNYLTQIVRKSDILPDQLTFIGVQKYLTSSSQERLTIEKGFHIVRLGDVRGENIHQVEPFLRDAQIVSFDACAIKHSEMPGQIIPMPNGIEAHQACQIAWYAGISDQMSSFGLFEINPETDVSGASVILGAQIIWHVLEGIAHRFGDYPLRDIQSYANYIVCHDDLQLKVNFYCNPDNKRWWVELSNECGSRVISCTVDDYDSFKIGNVPDRWWTILHSMSCESENK